MKKKAEFDLKNYLITFILVCGILVTFGTVAHTMSQDYSTVSNVSISSDFQNTYNHLDTISSTTEDIQTKMEQSDTGSETSGTQFYGGALQSLKLGWQTLGASKSMIQDMGNSLSVPSIWVQIFLLVITLSLIFAVIYLIFGR